MRRPGFTLIELLTVIAIAGVLAAVSLGSLNSLKQSGSLSDAAQEIVSVLRVAQGQALAGQGNANHTVSFSSATSYTHTANGATIGTYTLPSGVSCYQHGSTTIKPADIVFTRLTGTTAAVTIDLVNGSTTKTISLSTAGVITTQ